MTRVTVSTSGGSRVSVGGQQAQQVRTVAVAGVSENYGPVYNQANAAYTLANNAYISSNTVLVTAVSAYAQANAAPGIANTYATAVGAAGNVYAASVGVGANTYTLAAFNQGNTAYIHANNAYNSSNTVLVTAISAYAAANASNTLAIAAFDQANAARSKANSVVQLGFTSIVANGNTIAASSNSDILRIISGANIVITTNVGNNGIVISSTASGGSDALALATAQSAYGFANSINITVSSVYTFANSINITTGSAYGKANAAYSTAGAAFDAANNSGMLVYNRYQYLASVQNTFPATYTVGYIDVYINGAKLSNTDFTATSGTQIILIEPTAANDIVELLAWSTANITAISGGTLTLGYVEKNTNYTIVPDDDYIVNCTTNAFPVILPTAAGITGRHFIVKNSNGAASGNNINVVTTLSQLIDGETDYIVISPKSALTFVSTNASWILI